MLIPATKVAEIIGVHVNTVARWAREGRFKPIERPYQRNAPYLYDEDEIIQFSREYHRYRQAHPELVGMKPGYKF